MSYSPTIYITIYSQNHIPKCVSCGPTIHIPIYMSYSPIYIFPYICPIVLLYIYSHIYIYIYPIVLLYIYIYTNKMTNQ